MGSSRSSANAYPAAAAMSSPATSSRTGPPVTIRWYGTPDSSPKTVRRLSCRPTTSARAARRAARSTRPVSRSASGTLYVGDGPSKRYRNHRRRWAADRGTCSGRGRGVSAGRGRPAAGSDPAIRAANPATVGASKRSRIPASTPSSSRTRATTRAASSECPPRSKKTSSTPTEGTPRHSAKIAQRASSRASRGPWADVVVVSGSGNASRSSFPLAVKGNWSIATYADGAMYSGSCPAAYARTAPRSSPAGVTYATRRLSPGLSSRSTTAACDTSGCLPTADSTSPSSIRKPRSFTWWSTRATNSSSPCLFRRPRSPERYIREPGGPYGSATNLAAVRPSRFR